MIHCACGCNKTFQELDTRGRKRRFIHGHNKPWAGKTRSEETKQRIRQKILGTKLSEETKQKISKANRGKKGTSLPGELSPNWKGGRYISTYGYVLVYTGGKHLFEHRLVMEKHIGRSLTNQEIVHHINENRVDNSLENLQIVSRSEHKKIHKDIGLKTRYEKKV